MDRRLFLAAAAAAGFHRLSYASDAFPSRPIRLLVPFPAGGATDTVARILADMLQSELKQPFIVDNRPGGNNMIATRAMLGSPVDGYTLMMATNGMLSIAPELYKSLPVDTLKGFSHLGFISGYPYIIVTRTDNPLNDLKSFIDKAHRKEQVSYVVVGNVTAVAGATLKSRTAANMLEVRYKGNAEAISDLSAGRVDLAWLAPSFALPQIKGGKLKALAVTAPQRLPQLPDVPTVVQALTGIQEFDISVWNALVGPPGLPAEVSQKLARALANVTQSDRFRQEMERHVENRMVGSGEDVRKRIQAERSVWSRAIDDAGIARMD